MNLTDSPDSILSTFTAADGDNLAVQHWPAAEDRPRRGVVVLVHGLGEHAGRHERLARHLADWGFAVVGYDQCGHGESAGARGCLPSTLRLIEDLDDIVDSARHRLRPGEKLFVLGHSMGGLVAACWVLLREPRIDGLVLSAPALRADLGALQRLLLRVLPRIAPNLAVGNGLDPQWLSHDPEVVRAYRADPLVHDRISGRLARFIMDAGPRVLARAGHWRVPTLLMWGEADRIVNPLGALALAAGAPAGMVTARGFPGLYHEIFNELQADDVYATLEQWLAQRA